MIQLPAKGLAALLMCCATGGAYAAGTSPAAAPLVAPGTETQLVATSTAAPPTQQSFTIATAEDLVVTLTDLQIPAALVSAGVVVTQAGAVAGSAQLAAPATTATVALPSASGDYTIYVFGVPSTTTNVGTFTACVAPKATPANCIQSASLNGIITVQSSAQSPTVSTLSQDLTVTTAGAYTFTFSDLQFPVALATPPDLALFQGATTVQAPLTSGSSVTLSPGTYRLLAIAQADPTAQAGLYSISITDPTGASFLSTAEPVGVLTPPPPQQACIGSNSSTSSCTFNNPSAQSLTLTVADYGFPGPLSGAQALLTSGGTALGTATSAGGAVTVAAPMGGLFLWIYGSAGSTAGTYSVDVAGSSDLYTTAQGVSSGSTYAYAYVAPITTAGAYQATAADLQFPSQLSGLGFAVAQKGLILQQSTTATTVKFNAAAGNLLLLASAQAPASGSTTTYGLFDINVQATGTASPSLVFDQTQSVNSAAGGLFNSQPLTIAANASYDATLTDLKFPAAFGTLALVVSQGSDVLGKVFGGGKFSFTGTPGTYQLTFVATPAATENFGLYAASVVYSPPTVTLSSSVSSAAVGANITLSWSSTNASSCTATGGNFTGSQPLSSTGTTVLLSATTTYTLTCTGQGGTANQSVTVTATAAAGKSGGGGAVGFWFLAVGGALVVVRLWAFGARRSGGIGA
jgi:hypothetical protein